MHDASLVCQSNATDADTGCTLHTAIQEHAEDIRCAWIKPGVTINSIGAHLPIEAVASAPSVFDGSLEVTAVVLGPPEDLCRLAARAMFPWPREKALPVLPRLLL